MNNEKDWKKNQRQQKQEDDEKALSELYKINFKKENKKVDGLVKVLKIFGRILKICVIIVFSIVILRILLMLFINMNNIKEHTNVSIIETIENMYNVKVKVISKNIDEKENGIYKLELKDNSEIKFTANKEFGKLKEDFLDNSLKYYFNKWNSEDKKYFKVNNNITDEILDYSIYIKIEKYEDIEKSINSISEFAEFCDSKFYYSWDIYIEKDNKRIYPYYKSGISKEETIKKVQEQYKEYFN